jgi:hypothetical protein
MDTIEVHANTQLNIKEIKDLFVDIAPYEDIVPIDSNTIKDIETARQIKDEAINKLKQAEEEKIEAEKAYKKAVKKGIETENTKNKLEKIKREIELSKKEVDKIKKEFNDKKHELNMAWVSAVKAEEERKTKEAESKTAYYKTKRSIMSCIITILILAAVALFIGGTIAYNNNIQQEKAAQLEADRKSGKVCIPANEVEKYEGEKGVCVSFYVSQVSDNKYFTYINNKSYPNTTFTALVKNKKIISKDEAKSKYLNKTIEVRGDIVKYESTYEIEIYNANQIKVKD